MSVEALWTVKFGHAGNERSSVNAGIAVLETGRVLGGDSYYAYVGSYEATGEEITGRIHLSRHNFDPDSTDAWETGQNEMDIEFRVILDQDKRRAHGDMLLVGSGADAIKLQLQRVAELPD